MPTTHVHQVKSMKSRLEYVTRGRGELRRKHIANGTHRYLAQQNDFGVALDNAFLFFDTLRSRYPRRWNDGYEVRISWSPDELSADNDDDVRIAMSFGRALMSRLFPNSPCVITAHGDGVGHCLHLHCCVANHDLETNKSLATYNRTAAHVERVCNELARDFDMRIVQRGERAQSWSVARSKFEGVVEDCDAVLVSGTKWTRGHRDAVARLEIGDRVERALNDSSVTDVKSFEAALAQYGVSIQRKRVRDRRARKTVEGWTYVADDVEVEGKTRRRRAKASSLCSAFTASQIEETIAEHVKERNVAASMDAAATRRQLLSSLNSRSKERTRLRNLQNGQSSTRVRDNSSNFDFTPIDDGVDRSNTNKTNGFEFYK